jgi:hypothetical protein
MERTRHGAKSVYTPELGKKTAEVLRKTLSVEAAASFAGVSTYVIRQCGFSTWTLSPWGRDKNMYEALEFYKEKTKGAKTEAERENIKPLLKHNREILELQRGYKYYNHNFNMSDWLQEVKLQCRTKTGMAKRINLISSEFAEINERFENASHEDKELMKEEWYILKGKVSALKLLFKMRYCQR